MITRHPLFAIFILLMLAGNVFALYKLFADKHEFLTRFPRLTPATFSIFRFLPLINIIALAGVWFLKLWGAILALACAAAVICIDILFEISYHLYVAIPSALLLLFFLVQYRNLFRQ